MDLIPGLGVWFSATSLFPSKETVKANLLHGKHNRWIKQHIGSISGCQTFSIYEQQQRCSEVFGVDGGCTKHTIVRVTSEAESSSTKGLIFHPLFNFEGVDP